MLSLLLAAAQLAAVQVPASIQALPSIERMDDARICETMRGLSDRISPARPAQLGDASRLERITVVCAMREVNFTQAATSADETVLGQAADDLDAVVCRNPSLRSLAQRGWTLSNALTTPDGDRLYRDIDCGAGAASGAVTAAR